MKEPFEPHVAIVSGALRWCSSCLQISPASSRIFESRPLISDSSVCSGVHPGAGGALALLEARSCGRTARSLWRGGATSPCVSLAVGCTSWMPIEKPWSVRKRAVSLASRPIASADASAEWSRSSTREEGVLRAAAEDRLVEHAAEVLRLVEAHVAVVGAHVERLGAPSRAPLLYLLGHSRVEEMGTTTLGRSRSEKICLPVHISIGLRIAGGGSSMFSFASPCTRQARELVAGEEDDLRERL